MFLAEKDLRPNLVLFSFFFFLLVTIFYFSNTILPTNPLFVIDKSQAPVEGMTARTQDLILYFSFPLEKFQSPRNRARKLLQVRKLIGIEWDPENWNVDKWADPYEMGISFSKFYPVFFARSSCPSTTVCEVHPAVPENLVRVSPEAACWRSFRFSSRFAPSLI